MIYEMTVPQFIKGLRNLNTILGKAATHAEAKKIEMNVFTQSRLFPDQFNLARQVEIACDTAKLACSRLTGKEAPAHDDNQTSYADLNKRIESVISYLSTFTAKDFTGSDAKQITTPRWEGKWLTGQEFALHHAVPNFYFHVTTAYAILRHNGVDIGKKDYLGEMPFKK